MDGQGHDTSPFSFRCNKHEYGGEHDLRRRPAKGDERSSRRRDESMWGDVSCRKQPDREGQHRCETRARTCHDKCTNQLGCGDPPLASNIAALGVGARERRRERPAEIPVTLEQAGQEFPRRKSKVTEEVSTKKQRRKEKHDLRDSLRSPGRTEPPVATRQNRCGHDATPSGAAAGSTSGRPVSNVLNCATSWAVAPTSLYTFIASAESMSCVGRSSTFTP